MIRTRELIKTAILKFKTGGRSKRTGPLQPMQEAKGRPPADREEFHFAKGETSHELEAEPAEIPASYGKTRLVLLPVDPYLVHVYWEITESDLERVKCELGAAYDMAKPVLRFFDITHLLFDSTNAHSYFDIEINLRSKNWYVHMWSPERSYVTDLGFKTAQGNFLSMVRSNVVHTPRARPSRIREEPFKLAEEGKKISPKDVEEIELEPVQNRPTRIEGKVQKQKSVSPVDSAEVLRRELDDLYRFTKWGVDFFETRSFHLIRPGSDLTEFNEREFISGFSSMEGTKEENL